MLYVGLTEDHKGSATTFAHVVGAQFISQLVETNSSLEHLAKNISEQSSSSKEVESKNDHDKSSLIDGNTSGTVSSEAVEGSTISMTVGELMEAYEVCISNLRKSQAQQRTNSLKRISPVNFTKQARLKVPELTLKQVMSLNRLDMELYKYAQEIFARQHERTIQKLQTQDNHLIKINSYGFPPWKAISLGMAAIILAGLVLFLFVNARRRTYKVKI